MQIVAISGGQGRLHAQGVIKTCIILCLVLDPATFRTVYELPWFPGTVYCVTYYRSTSVACGTVSQLQW